MIITYRFVQNKFLISFYKKLFLSILTSSPPPPPCDQSCHFYNVLNVKPQLYAKGLVWSRGGGKHFSKTFSISYMLNSKNSAFDPYFFKRYWSNSTHVCAYHARVEISIFFMEKISFSLKLFFDHFYGQSFIKTVRGPLFSKYSEEANLWRTDGMVDNPNQV